MRADFISSLAEGSTPKSQLDGEMVSHFLGRKGLIMVDDQVDRMLDDATDNMKVPDKDRAAVLKELVKHFQH